MTKGIQLFGAALAVCLLSGCDHSTKGVGQPAESLPTISVHTQPVTIQLRLATEEVVGTIRPRLSTSISSKTSGVIEQLPVVVGQRVQAGELIALLDARETQARLDQAIALRDQAQKDMERIEKLLKQNIISQQEFDAAQAKFKVADATVNETKTTLGYAKITAPFSGVVTTKQADVGDLAAPGKVLITMEDTATLRFEADVPESLTANIKLQDSMSVRLAGTNSPILAKVSEIAPAADPNSRTFRIKFDLPSVEGLRSGQFGRVAVPVAQVDTLQVPASAIVIRGQMELAFVVSKQHAQMRLVKTGKRLGNTLEIVSGLTSGEQLVVDPVEKLLDGQPIKVL